MYPMNFKGGSPLRTLDRLSPKRAFLAGAVTLCLVLPAVAATGPFAEFSGNWSGNGTIRQHSGSSERIRCNATYGPRGASNLEVRLRWASDSYNFALTGHLAAAGSNQISGQWTENTRGIGGTIGGTANGDRMLMAVENGGFSADFQMTLPGKQTE